MHSPRRQCPAVAAAVRGDGWGGRWGVRGVLLSCMQGAAAAAAAAVVRAQHGHPAPGGSMDHTAWQSVHASCMAQGCARRNASANGLCNRGQRALSTSTPCRRRRGARLGPLPRPPAEGWVHGVAGGFRVAQQQGWWHAWQVLQRRLQQRQDFTRRTCGMPRSVKQYPLSQHQLLTFSCSNSSPRAVASAPLPAGALRKAWNLGHSCAPLRVWLGR